MERGVSGGFSGVGVRILEQVWMIELRLVWLMVVQAVVKEMSEQAGGACWWWW